MCILILKCYRQNPDYVYLTLAKGFTKGLPRLVNKSDSNKDKHKDCMLADTKSKFGLLGLNLKL